jgi:hypothetical protein
MEPDPVLVSNTKEWLLRAKEDLDNAQHDLMATLPLFGTLCSTANKPSKRR